MTARVLIVDDNEDNRCVLYDALEDEGYRLREAVDGVEALRAVEEEPPDVVLLDVMMPNMDGIECCRRLQASDATRHIPIILVTALSADDKVVEGLDAGAVDYIAKPFVGAVVRARVAAALRTKLAHDEVERSRARVEQLATQLQERNRELAAMALHDGLTGLPNRVLFMDRLRQAHARARRTAGDRFALLFLDFDGFKLINDSLGHEAGDELLKSIAERLGHELRDIDTVAGPAPSHLPSRLGGDEFVILLERLEDAGDAVRIADRLQDALARPHLLAGQEVVSTASIGIVTSDREYENAEAMLRDADIAMYRAKESGRACSVEFDQEMHEAVLARVNEERDLGNALSEGRVTVAYQPIFDLADGAVIGCEAMARWNHSERGVLVADDFMPFANEVGLIVPVGEYLVTSSLRQAGRWRREGSVGRSLPMTINLWERQLQHPGTAALIRDLLREEDLEPSSVNIDIPEEVFLDGSDAAHQTIDELRAVGVRIAMDACGRGHSALACLPRMPIDVLKLDRSVIANLDTKPQYAAVVHAVITLAHNLDLQVAAVGIESRGQLAQLQALECDQGQGQVFADGLSPDEFETLLERIGATPPLPCLGGKLGTVTN